MLLHTAYDLFQPAFVMYYMMWLDAGCEIETLPQSDDLFGVWLGGNEL